MSATPPEEPAHDVLAAEAFAMPTPDPTLRHGPVQLPDDPTGIEEAHDVLAAEEFAMPAPVAGVGGVLERRGGARGGGLVLLAALALLALLLIGRRRRG